MYPDMAIFDVVWLGSLKRKNDQAMRRRGEVSFGGVLSLSALMHQGWQVHENDPNSDGSEM